MRVNSEFEGRWIVKKDGNPFFIMHKGEGLPYAVKVIKETTSLGVSCLLIGSGNIVRHEEVRLATDGEVRREKTRKIKTLEESK